MRSLCWGRMGWICCVLTTCCLVVTPRPLGSCALCYTLLKDYDYVQDGNPSGYIQSGGHLWRYRYVQLSAGNVTVQIQAYPVSNPFTGSYYDHEETAYGCSVLKFRIRFPFSPNGQYCPQPAGAYVKGYVTANGTYNIGDADPDGGNPDFECWVYRHAKAIGTSDESEQPHISNWDTEATMGGNFSLSASDGTWYARPRDTWYEGARISATAHAHDGDGGFSTVYAYGTNVQTGWGVTTGAVYY